MASSLSGLWERLRAEGLAGLQAPPSRRLRLQRWVEQRERDLLKLDQAFRPGVFLCVAVWSARLAVTTSGWNRWADLLCALVFSVGVFRHGGRVLHPERANGNDAR